MTSEVTAVQDDMRPVAADIVQPLSSKSLFWQAGYMTGSAALPVLPFLFWTVESAKPRVLVALGENTQEPYFAMCQAVQRLGLETRCFSIAGAAPDSAVLRHNIDTYEDFSIIHREAQAAARARFDTASIDVLYLDLAHLPEDLAAWHDLLSPRSVLLIHGVRDPEQDAAREACLDQLRIKHIDFTLEHGAGLGMVLGADAPARLKRLAQLHLGVPGHSEVQKVFFRLGKAHENAFQARHEHRERGLLKKELTQLRQALEKAEQDHDALRKKTSKLRSAYEERNTQIALIEARHFDEVSGLRQAVSDAAKNNGEVEKLDAELAQHASMLTQSQKQNASLQAEMESLRRALHEQEARSEALGDTVARQDGELAEMVRLSEETRSAQESKFDWLRGEVAKYKKQADMLARTAQEVGKTAEAEIQALNDKLKERTKELDTQAQLFEAEKAQNAEKAKAQAEKAQTEISRHADAAEQTKKTADAEISALNNKLEERTTELVALTQLFEAEKAQTARTLADRQEWQDIRVELRDAEIAMLRGAGSRLRRGDAPSRAGLPSQKKQLEILRGSKVFDPDWYLKTYPDVAKIQADPASHYMLHGALDGRNPGPGFDTMAYYRANRDVARLGFNALVHYEMFGRNEKRKLRKDD